MYELYNSLHQLQEVKMSMIIHGLEHGLCLKEASMDYIFFSLM